MILGFELYRYISQAFQESLGLSVADYFGYLQSHWEELAQYKPLSDYPVEAASIAFQRLNRLHTYQFLMGLKPEFEALRAQIVNTSPMPSLFEAFATIDGNERQRHLSHLVVPVLVPTIKSHSIAANQMAFIATSGAHIGTKRLICRHCRVSGHTKDHCFKLYPELKKQYAHNNHNTSPSRTTAIVDTISSPTIPDLGQLQTQISLIQSQLGSIL